jgi:hypothetical protein
LFIQAQREPSKDDNVNERCHRRLPDDDHSKIESEFAPRIESTQA